MFYFILICIFCFSPLSPTHTSCACWMWLVIESGCTHFEALILLKPSIPLCRERESLYLRAKKLLTSLLHFCHHWYALERYFYHLHHLHIPLSVIRKRWSLGNRRSHYKIHIHRWLSIGDSTVVSLASSWRKDSRKLVASMSLKAQVHRRIWACKFIVLLVLQLFI